jgi:hypothetical protein
MESTHFTIIFNWPHVTHYKIPALNLLENRSSLYGFKEGRGVMLKQDLDK